MSVRPHQALEHEVIDQLGMLADDPRSLADFVPYTLLAQSLPEYPERHAFDVVTRRLVREGRVELWCESCPPSLPYQALRLVP